MTIKVGDKLPDATFKVMKEGKPADMTVADLTSGKKLALFAVPGAFTPTCWSLPQAFMTNTSFTDTHAIALTPLARISAAASL